MRPDREFKVQTVPVTDPGDLLASLRDPGALAWVRRGDGLVGWGEAATIILPAGPDRFAVAERSLRGLFDAAETEDDVGLPGCGPVAFGSFTFDAARGGSVLVLPRTVLGRRAGTAWMTTITPIGPGQVSQGLSSAPTLARLRGRHGSLTGPQWERAVAAAVARIESGQLQKVVLARDLLVTAATPINTTALLKRLATRDPDCYVFACAGLIGATPELLIQQEAAQVRSRVIAGTAERGSGPLLAACHDRAEARGPEEGGRRGVRDRRRGLP